MGTMTGYTFRDFLLDEMKQRQFDSASELARFFGVATTTVTRAMHPKNPRRPGFEFLLAISAKTGRNLVALLEIAYPDVMSKSELSPSAQLIAQQIEDLPESDRNSVRRLIRGGSE